MHDHDPSDDPASEETLATVASELHAAAVEAAASWIHDRIMVVAGRQGLEIDRVALGVVVGDVVAQVDRELAALLRTDIDHQRSTPLTVFRNAVVWGPTLLLRDAGADQVRVGAPDGWDVRDDPYALAPDNLADVGEAVHEAGIAWGAAKAYVHLARRRSEGLR